MGDCPVGSYTVSAIAPKDAAHTAAGRLQVTGGQSIRVVLDSDGTWALSDDGSEPLTVSADGRRAEGRLNGRISGTYAKDGDRYAFAQTAADGEVRVTSKHGDATLPLAVVGPALAPTGSVTLTCSATGLSVDSENVLLTLAAG